MTINVQIQEGDQIETVPQRMILYTLYENLERMLEEKNQMIQIVSQKNEHLENLLKLKSERIEDLEAQIARFNKKKPLSFSIGLNDEQYNGDY